MISWERGLLIVAAAATTVGCGTDAPAEPSVAVDVPAATPIEAEPARQKPQPTNSSPPPTPPDVPQLTARRMELLEAGKVAEAERGCRTWLAKQGDDAKAEGHKCLANVFVHQAKKEGASVVVSGGAQRLAVGGMAGPPRLSGMEVVRAIDHLDKAAELNPADLSIHEGRLFLCLVSGQYKRGVASLELSVTQYEDAEADTWLQYTGYFPRSAAEPAAAFVGIIVRANPQNARALVTLGGWQTVAGETAKASASLTKAIAASPRDAMAHWRMGELLELQGDRKGASAAYRKSLSLDGGLEEERQAAYERFSKRKPRR